MSDGPLIRGLVLDIQRGALHDGPGVRTTVFLKGCPLRCVWCHNPESWRGVAELSFDAEKCNDCLSCTENCLGGAHRAVEDGDGPPSVRGRLSEMAPQESAGARGRGGRRHFYDRRHCLACGTCVESCDQNALKLLGHEMTVADVMEIVERDRAFYTTAGGGMTISGGEPLAQPAFTRALLQASRACAISTCMDTSGEGQPEDLDSMLPFLDLVLFDYKATGPSCHRELTGSDGTRILANLDRLLMSGVPLILRVPLVPGVNDDEGHLDAIAGIAASGGVEAVEVMPYHALGRDKRRRLGRPTGPDWPSATPEQAQAWLDQLAARGCVARLG